MLKTHVFKNLVPAENRYCTVFSPWVFPSSLGVCPQATSIALSATSGLTLAMYCTVTRRAMKR